jgi:hypothetical protein
MNAPVPEAPVTLTVEQIEQICGHLATIRHDINNDLSKIVGTAELIKLELQRLPVDPAKPLKAIDRIPTLLEQPKKISVMIEAFSKQLEKLLGVNR